MTIKELIRAVSGRAVQPVAAADAEVSDTYLRKLQAEVDAKLKEGTHFTSVSRASW